MGSGASCEDKNSEENQAQIHNNPLLTLLSERYKYSLSDLKREIEQEIKDNKSRLNEADAYGLLPLCYAVNDYSAKDQELFQFLIEKGANIDKLSTYEHYNCECSMLHFAILEKSPRLVKFLLEHGISINPKETTDSLISAISDEEVRKKIHDLVSARRVQVEEEVKNKTGIDTDLVVNPVYDGFATAMNSAAGSGANSKEIKIFFNTPNAAMNPIHSAEGTSTLKNGSVATHS